jgi:hypothetical protein
MNAFRNPTLLKYARINAAGRESLIGGTAAPFQNFGDALVNRFLVALTFSLFSRERLRAGALSPIARIADGIDAEFFLAERDFIPHATILEGAYEGGDPAERERIFRFLKADVRVAHLRTSAPPVPLTFRYLLVGGANVLLACAEIPSFVFEMRDALAERYGAHGLKPLPMDPMLHITLGRMIKLPGQEQVGNYLAKMRELRRTISRDPIVLTAADVFVDPTPHFIKRFL